MQSKYKQRVSHTAKATANGPEEQAKTNLWIASLMKVDRGHKKFREENQIR